MTHRERADRRRVMATRVAEGLSLRDVAKEFGVRSETVADACIENGVPIPSRPKPGRSSTSALKILAKLYDPNLSMLDISASLGVTMGWVSTVYHIANRLGIPGLPERAQGYQPGDPSISPFLSRAGKPHPKVLQGTSHPATPEPENER